MGVSARTEMIAGSVHSARGFYIGDICYVLDERVYSDMWGDKYNFNDGCFEVPGTGYSFAVGSTAYGDGCYKDEHGNSYGVDAGVIGIVPLELCKKGTSGGAVFENPGRATYEMYEGRFKFNLPGSIEVNIDTEYEEDDEDDYEENYDSYFDDDDDEPGEGWD